MPVISARIAIAALGAVLITLVPALIEGRLLNRWGRPAELASAAGDLSSFPTVIGEWKYVREGEQLSEGVQRELGIAGHASVVYQNKGFAGEVDLLLMAGQPGRLVRHPPQICYAAKGIEQKGETKTITVSAHDQESEFDVLRYKSNSDLEGEFSVAFGFTTNGQWAVPKSPRMAYGGEPMLYKVQIRSASQSLGPDDDGVDEFLEQFVVTFQEFLREFEGG